MAEVGEGGKTEPNRAVYFHNLAVVEKGGSTAGVRPAGTGDSENDDAV